MSIAHSRLGAVVLIAVLITSGFAKENDEKILVTSEWLDDHLGDPNVVVLHVAIARSEYYAGHIPGARFVPWQSVVTPPPRPGSSELAAELPPITQLDSLLESVGVTDHSHIIIYGTTVQAARLFWTIEYLGFEGSVAVLDGGLDVWREEKRSLTTSVPTVVQGAVTGHPRSDVVVDAEWVRSHLNAPDTRLVDARHPHYYLGADSGGMARSGHLPGAVNLPYTVLTRELSKYRDMKTLRRLFEDAGLKEGDWVVAYCHVGQSASIVYFVSRLLGHEARIYDGSFQDWAKRSELPVETPIPPAVSNRN